MSDSKHLHAEIRISGMTCGSCELLLERKLKVVPGVVDVHIDHRTGVAHMTADASRLPSEDRIASVIHKAGYSVVDDDAPSISTLSPDKRKWMEIGGALIIIFAGYKLLQAFDLVSLAPSTSGALSFGGIFVIGLVAGTSSCLAVTGGLLLTLAAKHNEIHQAETPWQKFKPLLHFNIGRLVSYFILGGLVGVIGQSITLSTKMSGYMSIAVAFIMLWLALTILHIIPKGSFPIRPPKKLSRWVANLSESDHPLAPSTLGAMTFFLPCGFTQSLQLVALASGSFVTGAFTMLVFALGTLPSLIGLSAVSSTAKGAASRLFLRFSGALVLVLAFFNFNSGFALAGLNVSSFFSGPPVAVGSAPVVTNGVQEVSMKVTRYGYEPRNLTIKAGIPVRWTVDGEGAQGCTSQLVIPTLNVIKTLTQGQNIIEFNAPDPGQLAFSCSMGMVRGSFTVL
ncbi:MAG: Heavy metal transport/detoxification protein [Candidatus Peregrinibacteria bacterium Greene0416_19]|nr:MAG: Heavy metal transport/detoxification protein [Candidatus Peregrinibacteria bacterium Greene0416_19]